MKHQIFIGPAASGKTRKARDLMIGKKAIMLDGRDFRKLESKFAFNEVPDDTELLIIDDVPPQKLNFVLGFFFNDTLPIHRKGESQKHIPMPQVIITCQTEQFALRGYSLLDRFEVFYFPQPHLTAENIENLQAENATLRKVLEIARRYAIVEYEESAACRMIASEIQQVFPAASHSEVKNHLFTPPGPETREGDKFETMQKQRVIKLHHPDGHPYWQRNDFRIEMPDGTFADRRKFSEYRDQIVGEEVEVSVKEEGIFVRYFLCSSGLGKKPYTEEILLIPKSEYDKIEYVGEPLVVCQTLRDDLLENEIVE